MNVKKKRKVTKDKRRRAARAAGKVVFVPLDHSSSVESSPGFCMNGHVHATEVEAIMCELDGPC